MRIETKKTLIETIEDITAFSFIYVLIGIGFLIEPVEWLLGSALSVIGIVLFFIYVDYVRKDASDYTRNMIAAIAHELAVAEESKPKVKR